jgi:dsRNA-specific ribonuclease
MEALTAKSCSLPFNYDRLEYLGDAVLKLIQTDSLLYSTNERLTQWLKCLHEGDLSALRSAMGCNERLQEAAKKNGIDRFILVTPLDRSLWLPPFLKSYILDTNDTDEKEIFERLKPSNNVQADVIEALLGLIYLHHSFDIATQTAEVLGLAFPKQERQFRTNHRTSSSSYVGYITNFLGSQIENEVLLEEALTHPTVINTNVPNYQRMEWLGDAVLCLSAREWLCKQFYKMAVQ